MGWASQMNEMRAEVAACVAVVVLVGGGMIVESAAVEL